MSQLLSIQQGILKSFKSNVIVGIELSFHQPSYDFSKVIQKITKRSQPESFSYEILRRFPVSILPPAQSSQMATKIMALDKKDNLEYVIYPIYSRWYLLVNEKKKTLAFWTSHIDYTQAFAKDLEVAAAAMFVLFTGSLNFYTMETRLTVINNIKDIIAERIEKVDPLTIEIMRGGKIFPIKTSQAHYGISSLPSGTRSFIYADSRGLFSVQYSKDIERAPLKLISEDTSYFRNEDLPFLLVGYEMDSKALINGGIHLKGKVYVINDCLMRSGSSLVNRKLEDRIIELNEVLTGFERDNEIFHFIGQMQSIARTPRDLFLLCQQVLSSRQTLFYKSSGLFFHQSQRYNQHTSYEWTGEISVETFIQGNTLLLENYHNREKKYLLEYPPSSLKKSMSLLDLSKNANVEEWTPYYQIYTESKHNISDPRIISRLPNKKVDVIYAEEVGTDEIEIIKKSLKPGGYLVLKIAEAELLHSAFITYPQYNEKLILPSAKDLGSISIDKVEFGRNSWVSTSLINLIDELELSLISNYILDREIVLNSTEEMLTRTFSGVILRYGNEELSGLREPIKKEIITEEEEEEEAPLPEFNIPKEPQEAVLESATPDVSIPVRNPIDVNRHVFPLTQRPDYKPTVIRIPGKLPMFKVMREELANIQVSVKPKIINKCEILQPGDYKTQWTLASHPVRRYGSIGDGSCLIHVILSCIDSNYPVIRKDDKNLNKKLVLSKKMAQDEREDLAEHFTREYYDTTDLKELPSSEFSYSKLKKNIRNPSSFIGHELIPFISDHYSINILFFTCDNEKEEYVRYRDSRDLKDYSERDWICILWVNENHFEMMGIATDSGYDLLFDYNDDRIKTILN